MTSTSRVSLEAAWILHHYPYRDSSLLLEVFTREHGRIGLVARGARSARGRLRSHLQILRPLLLSWSLRGELGTLTGAEPRGVFEVLPGRQILYACYLNELLLRLLSRHDPHPGLYDAYEEALAGLPASGEQALRIFEKRLLQELGYGLLLDQEADTGDALAPDAVYEYQLERGPVRCTGVREQGLLLRGASLLALYNDDLSDPQACREVKFLMRAALGRYLGPKPLRTREVLRQLTQLSSAERLQLPGASKPLNAG
jgi:DNA repair protein RecO (recombination protein O)